MKIQQTNANLVYPKINEFRKRFALAEDSLKEHFMPATILPIPDQVQSEVPRAIVQSKHGHSILNVALTVSSFSTVYSGEFVDSWTLCEEYLRERCDSVYHMVDALTDAGYEYAGLITNVVFDDLEDPSLDALKKSLFKDDGNKLGNVFDVSCKLTYIHKDIYYINITLENTRELLRMDSNNGSVIQVGDLKNYVAVTIDVNDRYAVNQRQGGYKSEKSSFKEILHISADIVNNKLEKLICEGKYENEKG